jgi:signal transduction histidine kinase
MREQIELLGGTLTISSNSGRGTLIRAEVQALTGAAR